MRARLLWTLALSSMLCLTSGFQAKADDNQQLYAALESYAAKSADSYREALRLFLDLSYAYACSTRTRQPIPRHASITDSVYYTSTEGAEAWKDFCFSIIKSLYKKEHTRALVRPLGGRVYDYQDPVRFAKAAAFLGTDTASAPRIMLLDSLEKYKDAGPAEANAYGAVAALTDLIMDSTDSKAKEHTVALIDTLKRNLALYESKYRQGFRNRNIVEYFASATFNNFTAKHPNKLLSAPSPLELILLSKPIAGVSTHTIGKAAPDSNAIYLICPIAGIDRFNTSFTWYAGCSIFSAIPFAAHPFKKTYMGIEAHVADKALIGYGWNIDDIAQQKVFFTLPIVGGWFSSQQ